MFINGGNGWQDKQIIFERLTYPTMNRFNFIVTLLLSAFLLIVECQHCANINDESLQSILQNILNYNSVPSIAAAIVKNDTIFAAAAVGKRISLPQKQQQTQQNVTLCDRYHLGSDTKAFTSLLVGMMVEEGRITWNSTLGNIFNKEDADVYVLPDSDYAKITMVQLLSHTSGLPFDDILPSFNKLVNETYFQPGNLDNARRIIFKKGMTTIPVNKTQIGSFAYSNFGYMIVGTVLEYLTNTTWEQLVTERIFTPLNFQNAGIGCQVLPGTIDAPLPHVRNDDGVIDYYLSGPNCDNPLVMGPAGTAHMSILDFAEWARFQLNNGTTVQPLIASPETVMYLHEQVVTMEIADPAPGTPPSGGYAKGWGIITPAFSNNETLLFHGGSNGKNLAYIILDMKKQYGLVIVTNMGGEYADAVMKNATETLWKFSTS